MKDHINTKTLISDASVMIQEPVYIFCSLATKFVSDDSHSANWSYSWTTNNVKEQNQSNISLAACITQYDKEWSQTVVLLRNARV